MTKTPTLSQRVGQYVAASRFEDCSPAAVQKAKSLIAYHVGLAFTGATQPAGITAIRIARRLSPDGPCRVIGQGGGFQPLDAAFANCTLMRANGRDDVLFPVGVHAGLVAIPVALALGEAGHRSGRDALAAVIAGYEVIGALGESIWAWDSPVPRRPTIPFGPFGSATVAARMLGLDAAAAAQAIGYAAHQAMGLAIGDLVTHYYSLVTRNGILAAIAAQEGGIAAGDVLEGRHGFYETFFGGQPPAIAGAVEAIGRVPRILDATVKRYDGTALNIVPIELMVDLVERHAIRPDDLRELRIWLPEERANFVAGHHLGPFEDRGAMASSAAFQVAAILHDGRLADDRFERAGSPGLGAILDRTRVHLAPDRPIRWARLELELTGGRSLAAEGSDHVFPEDPPLALLARHGEEFVPFDRLEAAVELIEHLEDVDDVAQLMDHLVPPRPSRPRQGSQAG